MVFYLQSGCRLFSAQLKIIQMFSYSNIKHRLISKLTKNKDPSERLRNIGIIAHIDAGKTTTTERMLYYSGLTQMMGEVHDGDTVMDYMLQERERGITITSAAITFNWKKHKINLIDTPGHVDFTFEVERSLSVLDGAIVILDASAGVEVQTLKVWVQSNNYNLPCIIYLNKMDKTSADVDMCLQSVKNKLKTLPLMLQLPLGNDKTFKGVIDLVTLQKHFWYKENNSDGRLYHTESISQDELESLPHIYEKRQELIENIANIDDNIADMFITDNSDAILPNDLLMALRRITLKKLAVPVLCGSSYKNVSVQLLMDAVINYLPSPYKNHEIFKSDSEELCAFVFKIIHNKNREALTFLRVYSGSLKTGQRIYNGTKQCSEKIGKLMVPHADKFQEIPSLTVGNIGVVTNLKITSTGDIIFSSGVAASKNFPSFEKESEIVSQFPTVHIPDPVFFCTIEPPSVGQQKHLDFALSCLQREDPTFQVENDEIIGQTILKGMGELHIDVIKSRILSEYGVDAYLGPLQVAYRETLNKQVENTHILDKIVSGSKHFVTITIRIYPCHPRDFNKNINIIVTKENNLEGKLRTDYLKAIESGIKSALNSGPLLSFPVINVGLDLLWLEVGKHTSLAMLTAATAQCINAAFRKTTMQLLEPIMSLSIAANKDYTGRVINDLSQKRSQILNMEQRQDVAIIQSLSPLSELRGYSTKLRALTSGTCSFTIQFESYNKMDLAEQARAIKDVTGF